MRVLYLSCHETLEYQEISLFHELGVDVFPIGAYMEQDGTIKTNDDRPPGMRPPIDGFVTKEEDRIAYHEMRQKTILDEQGQVLLSGKVLTKEFVDRFDVVMVMHVPIWMYMNWDAIKHKIVFWRTIGQSIQRNEESLRMCRDEGMRIIRYSPKERTLPGYLGEDYLIRFYKDPDEFCGWKGDDEKVISICQSMESRGRFCNFWMFNNATRRFDRRLFGTRNESSNIPGGTIPFEQLKEELRKARVYFYVGTQPASYTLNFIEAFMTGIPCVCIGPESANSLFKHDLYEIPEFIQNGVTGFWSDDVYDLERYVKTLMDDHDLAKQISRNARNIAIKCFGKKLIKSQWKRLFDNVSKELGEETVGGV